MNRVELIARRRVVQAFIKADPVSIELSRASAPVKSAAGGFVSAPRTDLPSQQFRIVLNKRRYTNGIVNSEAGEIPHTDYLLIGEYRRDVAEDDQFQWLGENYRVTGIYKARTESILAAIDLLGHDNRGS